jgi:hypothetical protein
MKYVSILIVAMASFASAGELSLTRVDGTFSGSGGEFNLTPDDLSFVGGVPALDAVSLQSFCLEMDESVTNGTATYDYVVNTGAVLGGVGGFDPLSPITAWMYENFIHGTLLGYDYGVGREASAAALQNAIWYTEGEVPDLTTGTSFYQQAVDAAPTSIGRVRVLNLYHDGEHRQDQIFMQAPEPSTLVLGFLALVCFWRRT